VIQERDGSNNPTVSYTRGADLSRSFGGAGGIGGLLARSSGYSSSTGNWSTHYCYHADGNGNITYLVDSSQNLAASYRYDPFGNTLSSTGTIAAANVYRFSSKEAHANSGSYYYLYRFYDPNLQRWLNRDPLGELGAINLYSFAGNRPIILIDPYGLFSPSQFLRGIAGLGGGISLIVVGVALSEAGVGIPIAVSGAVGIGYGIGNIVASFAPPSPQTELMQGSPHNLCGAVGRLVGGEKGQALGSTAESAVMLGLTGNEDPAEQALQAIHSLEGAYEFNKATERID
jgi:RHS repeat-associated protein